MAMVSVVIPVYNGAVTLRRCLNSVLAQNGDPMEVIVVDDGSTDGTTDVAASYGSRIIVLVQENQGQAAARNAGLSAATGQYVAFLDADDYWLPGFLRTTTGFLDAHPEASAVSVGQLIKVWGKPPRIRPRVLASRGEAVQPCVLDDFFAFWARHDHIRTGSAMMRREVIERAGYQRPDLRLCEDLEYWGYLATFGAWGFIPEVLFVSDGSAAAASTGWLRKYVARGRVCPTVEQWQERIVPRLQDRDWQGFRQVRGRIAATFAHAKILAGDDLAALRIVRRYGSEFARRLNTRLMLYGAAGRPAEWKIACRMLRLRERAKSVLIWLSCVLGRRDGQWF